MSSTQNAPNSFQLQSTRISRLNSQKLKSPIEKKSLSLHLLHSIIGVRNGMNKLITKLPKWKKQKKPKREQLQKIIIDEKNINYEKEIFRLTKLQSN
jgi:hypothetical protein